MATVSLHTGQMIKRRSGSAVSGKVAAGQGAFKDACAHFAHCSGAWRRDVAQIRLNAEEEGETCGSLAPISFVA